MKDLVLIGYYGCLFFFDIVIPTLLQRLNRKLYKFCFTVKRKKGTLKWYCRERALKKKSQERAQREIKAYRIHR